MFEMISKLICKIFPIVLVGVLPWVSIASSAEIDQGEVCVVNDARKKIDPKRLMRWLLSEYPVSPKCLDYNDDAEPQFADSVLTLVHDDYRTTLNNGRCKPIDQDNILKSQNFMISLFVSLNKNSLSGFEAEEAINLGANVDYVRPILLYNDAKLSNDAIQVSDQLVQVYKFFTNSPDAIDIVCLSKSPEVDQAVESRKQFADRFVIRGKIEDLKKPLTPKSTKQLSSAEFSAVDNRESDKTEYNINGVVGIRVGDQILKGNLIDTELIAFVGLEKRFSTGDADDEIDNLKIGLTAGGYFLLGSSAHGFDLYPQITLDSEADTKIGSLNLVWEPALMVFGTTFPNIGISGRLGTFVPTLKGYTHAGHVFADGGNENLRDDHNFVRIGPEVGLKFFANSGTFIDQIVWYVTYKYLWGAIGDPANADRLEIGLSYVFPKTENFSFGVKYTKGEADETFEDVESLEMKIGIKF